MMINSNCTNSTNSIIIINPNNSNENTSNNNNNINQHHNHHQHSTNGANNSTTSSDNNNNNNTLIGDIIIPQHEYNDLMEPWAYTTAGVCLGLIGFFGFTLNLFVIILMLKDMQLWTPMNIILFNLVCSDLAVSIFGNPLALIAAFHHRWIFGSTLCVYYGFFMALLGITSITTLTVLSYERYCLVKFPFSTKQLNNRNAIGSIIFIWIYSLSLTIPPIFGWGAYVNEAANISCSVNWETRTHNATSYILFLFTFGLIIPVSIIIHSYCNIIFTMKKNSKRLGRKHSRVEGRITLMIGSMIIAFIVAWSPYAVFALIEQFGDAEWITPAMAVLPSLIAKSSICYNPIIYVGMNSQYRQALKRLRGIKNDTTADTMNTTNNQLTRTRTDDENRKICIPLKNIINDEPQQNDIDGKEQSKGKIDVSIRLNVVTFKFEESKNNDYQMEKPFIYKLKRSQSFHYPHHENNNQYKKNNNNLKTVFFNNNNNNNNNINDGKYVLTKSKSYQSSFC